MPDASLSAVGQRASARRRPTRISRSRPIGWWGMTETITHGIGRRWSICRIAPMSMGRPAPEYEVRIERSTVATPQPGEAGDFLIRGIRGLSLFAEYLGNPRATAESFDADGWFITGDSVKLGEDGWLYFSRPHQGHAEGRRRERRRLRDRARHHAGARRG